jgi:sortase A
MKKIITLTAALAISAALAFPAFAADYSFGSGGDTLGGFGGATSVDTPVTPDPMSANTRRNKDAALLPPPYGIFSGEIPTDPSSPYHSNLKESGFVPQAQDLPANGGESYAPGSSDVTTGFLPTTSQTANANTAPWYYDDGTIGTLTLNKIGKAAKVYEGESLDNLKIGLGHFSATSAWDGNVALAGHNRSGFFGYLKDAEVGDTITYTTKYGERTYRIYSKTQIGEYDNLPLNWSAENILTLITCVENTPELRWCVRARAIN